MKELYSVDMNNMDEKAHIWPTQTVHERIETCINLLKINGLITSSSATKAFGRLEWMRHRQKMTKLKMAEMERFEKVKRELNILRGRNA